MWSAAVAHEMKEFTDILGEVLYRCPSDTKGRCRRIMRTLYKALIHF